MPKYDIKVKLIGEDGNAFSILGKVRRALLKAKVPQNEVDEYLAKAKSGDYNNLLAVTMEYVHII